MIYHGKWHGDERYFGLHYDLHAGAGDTDLGTRCSEAELVPMLELDRAIKYATPLFRPDALVSDAVGCRAAARALKEVDCHKALPLALAFLKAIPREKLPAFQGLDAAQLDGIRLTFSSLLRMNVRS